MLVDARLVVALALAVSLAACVPQDGPALDAREVASGRPALGSIVGRRAVARLEPLVRQEMRGTVFFRESPHDLAIEAVIASVQPGSYQLLARPATDCSRPAASPILGSDSPGVGGPVGDLGVIEVGDDGAGRLALTTARLSLEPHLGLIGKIVTLAAVGDGAELLACGVVEARTLMVEVRRAAKYGFCSGVRLADMKVRRFAEDGGRGKILGQVVHNERVVRDLEQLGVETVDVLDEVAQGTIVFSAHGVPPSFHSKARRRGLKVLDTTCPFVYDIHDEAEAARRQGEHLVFIGDPQHREVIGYTNDLEPEGYHIVSTVEQAAAIDWSQYSGVRVFYQTTLNADDYEDVVKTIERGARSAARAATICYATKENQDAARDLAADPGVELIIVVGGRKSANTRHLWELCERFKPSFLIHEVEDLDALPLAGAKVVGLTAGASTPDAMIDEVEARIVALAAGSAAPAAAGPAR